MEQFLCVDWTSKHAPLISRQVTVRPNTAWFDDGIATAKRKRRQAERKWRSTKLTVHLEIYKESCANVSKMCHDAKCHYYQNEITTNSQNPKALFRITDRLLNKAKVAVLPEHANAETLANDFVEYFDTKIRNITASFPEAVGGDTPGVRDAGSMLRTFSHITEDDIRKLVMSGNSKCCQLDPIPTKLLKDCIDCILPIITRIVNQSITSSIMPLSLKSATVTPLIKKPTLDPDDKKNYRPVSNLAYISKLIEKAVVAQLQTHMKDNDLHPTHQSAYRKNHSTETALLRITNDILREMDCNKCSLIVMLDQSAAFDTVNLDVLINRLECTYGINSSALDWLKSYYNGRTQTVQISGMSSTAKTLLTGFPQGSVLGPFQYPTYTAPLFNIASAHGLNMHMYADDTQIYLSFPPEEYASAYQRMQICLTEIHQWMIHNHLKLNASKTDVVLCGTPHNLRKIDVSTFTVGGDTVEISQSARNIGAVIDRNLTMSAHVNSVIRACYMKLRQISHIRPFLTEEATATLVRTLILSKLDYVNSLLVGLPDGLIHKLQLIQNNAARLVTRKRKRDHVTPLLMDLHWLPVKQRIEYKVNLITYKALHGYAPPYIRELLTVYEPRRTLRSESKGKLVVPRSHKKSAGDRAFSVSAPRLWNELPQNVTECKTIDSFKKHLKTHLFNIAYKS